MNGAAPHERLPRGDAVLLRRFIEHRDAEAFRLLVERYQRLVMGVALRQVGDRHRAEDVFQATFLVLAERAGRIRKPESLACWLHGTARRIGLQALADIRRQTPMRPALPEPSVDESTLQQMQEAFERQALDEELTRLPEHLRLPLVLHYLEGLTGKEVAERLGVSADAVEGRLKQGRNRLRERLTRHGIGFGVVTAAFQLSAQTAVASTAPLVEATTAASLAWVNHQSLEACSANAARLAGKELATMTAAKSTLLLTTTAVLCLGTGIVGALALAEGPGGRGVAGLGRDIETVAGTPPAASELPLNAGPPVEGTASPTGQGAIGPPATRAGVPGLPTGTSQGAAAGQFPGEGSMSPIVSESYAQWPASRQAIEKSLEEPAAGIELRDVPLIEAVDFLADRFGIAISLDLGALEEIGVVPDVPVELKRSPSDATARDVLELVLHSLSGHGDDVDYIIRNGVLTITTRARADYFLETVVYELRDLVASGIEVVDVMEAIQNGTGVEWLDVHGSLGTITELPGAIVVRQSQRGHREIEQILAQLRRFAARTDMPQAPRRPRGSDRTSGFGGGLGDTTGGLGGEGGFIGGSFNGPATGQP